MSRRGAIDHDDDYYDDGYYDEDEEDEDEPDPPMDGNTSQYMWRGNGEHGVERSTSASKADLLDSLVLEFRSCLGDERISRDQIDAVMVATDYDPEAALTLLTEQMSAMSTQRKEAASRLVASNPSSVAQMLEDDAEDRPMTELPTLRSSLNIRGATREGFRFDEPSPDDSVHQGQRAGRARAASASAGGRPVQLMPKPKGDVKLIAGNPSSKKQDETSRRSQTTGKPGSASSEQVKVKSGRPRNPSSSGSAAPEQRARGVKIPALEDARGRFPSVSIVVSGHVDAGKSTLLCHFLDKLEASRSELKERPGAGRSSKSTQARRATVSPLAWGTDEDAVEQTRGVTIDIATRNFRGPSNTLFSIIDAPGHRDYVPAMILGSSQASAALLVVDTSIGEFEAGFCDDGQTKEHAVLLRSLGISRVIVVANKMDMTGYSKERFTEVKTALSAYLKSLGWKPGKDIDFVPTSGLNGVNLIAPPGKDAPDLKSWYYGNTLLGALEAIPVAAAGGSTGKVDGPTRLVVSDAYRSSTLGGVIAVSGRLVSGSIAPRDSLRLCPTTEIANVKAIEVGGEPRRGNDGFAMSGVDNIPVSLGLENISDAIVISPGDVLCDPRSPVPVVKRFRGQVVVISAPVPVVQGLQVELHVGGMCEAATLSKLLEMKVSPRGDARKRPRQLAKGCSAVVEVTVDRAVCIDLASSVKFLGRFALRCQGRTIAAGVVTELLKDRSSKKKVSSDSLNHGQ